MAAAGGKSYSIKLTESGFRTGFMAGFGYNDSGTR
jgi:hypothetical protein